MPLREPPRLETGVSGPIPVGSRLQMKPRRNRIDLGRLEIRSGGSDGWSNGESDEKASAKPAREEKQ